jgi:hypothetical protein
MPDGNNVYGQIVSPDGLQPILRAARRLVGDGRASIYKAQFNGAETLRFTTETVDFESIPLKQGDRHLLNGGITGDSSEVVSFVEAMSRLLQEAGIEHSFEVYDAEKNLVRTVPHEQMIEQERVPQ